MHAHRVLIKLKVMLIDLNKKLLTKMMNNLIIYAVDCILAIYIIVCNIKTQSTQLIWIKIWLQKLT